MKRLGIPDSQIILMLADDVACNPRNPFAGTVFANAERKTDLYGDKIEVDYKGEEVNVETFLRLLSGEETSGPTLHCSCCAHTIVSGTVVRPSSRVYATVEATHDRLEEQYLRLHDWPRR